MPDNGQKMHFYTTQKISGRRSTTPEGYLLIEGVPLARTGRMIYGPREIPIPGGPDGLIHIERNEDEVFRPQTIASANGKSLVNNHPDQDVCPDNWRMLTDGIIMNPRRGTGIEDDFLIGDVLVTTREGIGLVTDGKVELSMGYDADYMMTGPGRGVQRNIVYNHVALVDKGRCGPRCSIGDRTYLQEKNMPKASTADRAQPQKGILAKARDKLLKAVRSGTTIDEEMLEETLGDEESEAVAEGRQEPTFVIHNHHGSSGDTEMAGKNGKGRDKEDGDDDDKLEKKTEDMIRKVVGDAMGSVLKVFDQRMKDLEEKTEDKEDDDKETKDNEKILGALCFEAPPGTNDKELKKTRDSSFLDSAFRETLAYAEILAPGIRAPTFDRAMDPKAGLDTICNLRRTSLDVAYAQDIGVRNLVDALGAQAFRTMDCQAIKPAFVAAAELRKRTNNAGGGGGGDHRTTDAFQRPSSSVGGAKTTIAEVNQRNKEYWANKDGKKSA